MEAIILAGGLGTRLRSVVSDLPKCMAFVAHRPFLEYVLDDLVLAEFSKIILAVGYKAEAIQSHFKDQYKTLQIKYSFEDEPLGTGGAIYKALLLSTEDNVFILNGDTLFRIKWNDFFNFHINVKAIISIAARKLDFTDRQGCITFGEDGHIIGFEEKSPRHNVEINGGIYIINKGMFQKLDFPEKFSFEKDFLESQFNNQKMYAFSQSGYFIDIGIPKDYQKAQKEFLNLP